MALVLAAVGALERLPPATPHTPSAHVLLGNKDDCWRDVFVGGGWEPISCESGVQLKVIRLGIKKGRTFDGIRR